MIELNSFRLAVLNLGGRDADQDFSDGAGLPDPALHAPVNYHGYAAATGGSFLRSIRELEKRGLQNVILLLRSDLKSILAGLRELRRRNCRIFLSFKESGLQQVSQTLRLPGRMAIFSELCQEADGAISSTEDLVPLYLAAGARRVEFIPTPYPVEDGRWDFAFPVAKRSGIFVGTREFGVPSRNHALAFTSALALGAEFSETVTLVNEDGRAGRKWIATLAAGWPKTKYVVVEGRRSYPDYLKMIAPHKLIWQWDASSVPGQVAGDALLCRVPCVGGNGTTERLAFPRLTSHGRTLGEGMNLARRLLADASFYEEIGGATQVLARTTVGFEVVREKLAATFSNV